jgi:hypothetical protein
MTLLAWLALFAYAASLLWLFWTPIRRALARRRRKARRI